MREANGNSVEIYQILPYIGNMHLIFIPVQSRNQSHHPYSHWRTNFAIWRHDVTFPLQESLNGLINMIVDSYGHYAPYFSNYNLTRPL